MFGKKFFFGLIFFMIAVLFVSSPCLAKDKIVIGQPFSLSGPLASGAASSSGPFYKLWVKQVNADGGIYVEEYGKKLPVELIRYDDKSDVGTMTKLLEKLILEDEVDFIFPPWSTAMLYAAAPICNKHGYILIGGAGGAVKLKDLDLPYFFQVLNDAETQMPELAEIFADIGVKSAAVVYRGDLHGIEYSEFSIPEFKEKGIEVKMQQSYSPGIKDMSSLMKKAKSKNVDAFVVHDYPGATMLGTSQAMELGINFKALHFNVGPCFTFYPNTFGSEVVEGVIGCGAWNGKSTPGAQDLIDRFNKNMDQKMPDYWGGLFYYSSLQHFRQAIEEAGTLDQEKIRDVMASKTYKTDLGDFWYNEDRIFTNHPGQIGQWQNGVFEVIDTGEKRTAEPIYPKPKWPGKKKK
ncbi:MAG: amino acid ABC transporter substrate-binding protein [Desulfobacteraceae bacterium]|nr:amino acid ABC transporter substrate-binding protein [Desulfobacteraceae bacterium]